MQTKKLKAPLTSPQLKLHKALFLWLLTLPLLVPIFAEAYDLRWGGTIGYGGAGVKQTVEIEGIPTGVQKSEGPGVASIFVENLLSDDFVIGGEHSFGFRFGPFSTGASFTGITGRWYVYGPAIFKVDESSATSTYFVKRYAPFYGFGSGVATAYLTRPDLAAAVSSSGVYIGFKGGADYSYQQDMIFRYEVIYNTTFMSSVSPASTLSEFALQFGIYYFYK